MFQLGSRPQRQNKHGKKPSHMNFLVSQCIYVMFALYCGLLNVLYGIMPKKKKINVYSLIKD